MTKNNVFLGFPLKKTPLCTNAQLEYVKHFSASIYSFLYSEISPNTVTCATLATS